MRKRRKKIKVEEQVWNGAQDAVDLGPVLLERMHNSRYVIQDSSERLSLG